MVYVSMRKLQNAERARAEKDREAEDLRSQLEGAESIKDDLGQQNTKLKLHIRENETEMMELKAYRQKYEDLKRSGDQSAGMKDREIDELQADVARLRQAKTAAEDRANDLESDLDTAQSRETAATRAKNTLQARIQELEGEQDDYIVEIEQANAARKQAEVKYAKFLENPVRHQFFYKTQRFLNICLRTNSMASLKQQRLTPSSTRLTLVNIKLSSQRRRKNCRAPVLMRNADMKATSIGCERRLRSLSRRRRLRWLALSRLRVDIIGSERS